MCPRCCSLYFCLRVGESHCAYEVKSRHGSCNTVYHPRCKKYRRCFSYSRRPLSFESWLSFCEEKKKKNVEYFFFVGLSSTQRFPCVPQYMAHVPFICSVVNSGFSSKENGLYSALAEDTQTSRHTVTQLERLDPLARRPPL